MMTVFKYTNWIEDGKNVNGNDYGTIKNLSVRLYTETVKADSSVHVILLFDKLCKDSMQ